MTRGRFYPLDLIYFGLRNRLGQDDFWRVGVRLYVLKVFG